MSDNADDFFKPGARPNRRNPANPQERLESQEPVGDGSLPASPDSVPQPLTESLPSPEGPPASSDSPPSPPEPPMTVRRAPPNLSALFGEEKAKPAAPDHKPGDKLLQSETPGHSLASVPPAQRRRDAGAALDRLIGEASASANPSPSVRPNDINPEFERFLSPETWRRLRGNKPQRRTLITAQERMRSVLFQLSTFLPSNLVQEKNQRPVPGLVAGKMLRGCLLFSDVSGFTTLSERLAVLGPAGAERLTVLMNEYFATMLDIIAASGGILIKFAGDATLVYFPQAAGAARTRASTHRPMAVRTGLRMLEAMHKFSEIEAGGDRVSLKMKVGISSGEFLAASIGSVERMEYAVLGPAVSAVMSAESASTAPGQLIVDDETAAGLDAAFTGQPHKSGFQIITQSEGQSLDQFEIQAGTQRARSGINWSAAPEEILQNMGFVLRQITAILPYIPTEISNRVISQHSQRRVEGEFRPVVTIFCNFSGPENLLALWGPQGSARITAILSAYFNAMHQAIHRFGGVITRIDPYSKGTKLLILFGAPISHEDDPQRAVSAALTMNMELEQVNLRLMQKFARFLPQNFEGPLLQHRTGITYGEIFAAEVGASTRREYTVMGDDVNLAARLMGAGQSDQILLSAAMIEAIGHDFLTTTLNPIRVKGKSKPVPIFQVDGPAENILINRLGIVRPLIGRKPELEKARTSLALALAGQGSMLVLEGPAGIGKTHLADTLLLEARQSGARLLAAQCRSYTEDIVYSAWSVILRSAAGITNIDPPQLALKKFDLLMATHKTPSRLPSGQERTLLGSLMGIPPPPARKSTAPGNASRTLPPDGQTAETNDWLTGLKDGRSTRRGTRLDFIDQLSGGQVSESGQTWEPINRALTGTVRQHTYDCVIRLLGAMSAHGPMVLFFEDANWLDEGSVDLLLAIQENLADLPILIVFAARNCNTNLVARASRILLAPLPESETTALVADILVSELGPVIFEQTGGNPLFVAEVARWIQRTRRISAGDLVDVLRASDVLQKLILSRVENLPEAPRQVIRAAAVIGPGFRISVLQAALGSAVDPVSLSTHLRSLVDASLLQSLEGGVDSRYAFQQELVRTVLYNSLSFDRRHELHGRIADSLASSKPSRRQLGSRIAAFLDASDIRKEERQAALIAYHQEGAERFLQAAQTYLSAAQLARQRKDWIDADQYYQKALNVLKQCKPRPESQSALNLTMFNALVGSADIQMIRDGSPKEAFAVLETAQNIPDSDLSPEAATALGLRLAVLLPALGKPSDGLAMAKHTYANAPATLRPLASAVYAWLAYRHTGQIDSGLLETAQDAAASLPGLQPLLAELRADWQAASAGYLALDLPQAAALMHIYQGDVFLAAGDGQAADQHYLQAARLWRNNERDAAGLALAAFRHAAAAKLCGNNAAARRALNHTVRRLQDAPAPIRREGRIIVRQANKLVDAEIGQPWPSWRWDFLVDHLKLTLFYPQLQFLGL